MTFEYRTRYSLTAIQNVWKSANDDHQIDRKKQRGETGEAR